MKFKTEELRSFKHNSSHIKQNGIIPILGYIKFEDGELIKNNLHSFVRQKISPFKGKFLVEEKMINSFVDQTSSTEIDITIKNGKLVLSDGRMKDAADEEEVGQFPITSQPEGEFSDVPQETIKSINQASSFVDANNKVVTVIYVFVNERSVCGSNAWVIYANGIDTSLPEMILSKETAVTVGKMKDVKFQQSDNYHFG